MHLPLLPATDCYFHEAWQGKKGEEEAWRWCGTVVIVALALPNNLLSHSWHTLSTSLSLAPASVEQRGNCYESPIAVVVVVVGTVCKLSAPQHVVAPPKFRYSSHIMWAIWSIFSGR